MPHSKYVESLYEESERRENFGACPHCEEFSAETGEPSREMVLCYICGVCFKYHHDENYCDPVDGPDIP